jgi:hypothetical protein
MYTLLTQYEGIYIAYLVPIVYGIVIVVKVLFSNQNLQKRIGTLDVIA